MREAELRRCMVVITMTAEQRMALVANAHPTAHWFLENIDGMAPDLLERGWIEQRDFDHKPGSIVVTTGAGDVRMVVATQLGLAQLSAVVN